MSAKPTIILVHGAWHRIKAYKPLSSGLEAAGYRVIGIDLPSVVAEGEEPTPDFSSDRDTIAATIGSEVDSGNQVALVLHSYSGIPGSEAVKGFEKHVVRLVFLCAHALPLGGSLLSILGGQWLPWFKEEGKYLRTYDQANIFYNDISADEAKKHTAELLLQSPGSFRAQVTYAGWQHVPSAYILCEKDNAIPAPAQEQMASQEGAWCMRPIRLDVGHSPFLAKPNETVMAVRQALGEA